MADIRINALATTAASTASDDFIAVDGSANGTRKLNAYSPTFGGNLTVSGAGTTGGNLRVRNALGYATGIHTGTTSDSTQQLLLSSNAAYNHAYISKGSTTLGIGFSSDNGSFVADDSITITAATKLVTLAGNLTVSGTGTSSVAGSLGIATTSPNKSSFSTAVTVNGATNSGFEVAVGDTRIAGFYAASSIAVLNAFANVPLAFSTNNTTQMQLFANGNLFIGASPVDGGQKLQVNGSVNVFGGGTLTVTNAANTANIIRSSDSSGNAVDAVFKATGTTYAVQTTDTSGNLQTALTLDSSQNATFAGKATASGQIRGANVVASNLGSADNGFYGTAGTDAGSGHRLALVRTDTPTGGSALLSAFGAAVVEVNATTGLNTGTRALTIDTSANATFAGSIAIGNTVNTVSPTSPNRTITMVIGGTTYYIHAKTTND